MTKMQTMQMMKQSSTNGEHERVEKVRMEN